MTPNTEVVCIDNSGTKILKNGNCYTVLATRASQCKCNIYDVYLGFHSSEPSHKVYQKCGGCGERVFLTADKALWFRATRFVPIDSISISEAYEVLEKEPFEL